jgi:hypothetical protein
VRGTGLRGAARAALIVMCPTLCSIAVPVRLPSWLTGDLGKCIEQTFRGLLRDLPRVALMRVARGFVVESYEAPGPFLEAVHRAVMELEVRVEEAFPVLYHELGPVWAGSLQAVFPAPQVRRPASVAASSPAASEVA